MVEAAGIEPASAWLLASASTCVVFVQSRRGQSQRREQPPPRQTWFSSRGRFVSDPGPAF